MFFGWVFIISFVGRISIFKTELAWTESNFKTNLLLLQIETPNGVTI